MAGSRDADFMEFVRARSLALRRTAYLLCGDWSAGDDLVQESLAKVYVAWPRIAEAAARAHPDWDVLPGGRLERKKGTPRLRAYTTDRPSLTIV